MTLWEEVRPWLVPALDDADEAELLAKLGAGAAQLWAGDGAAMVTQITEDRICHCWLAGGDLAEILRLRPGVEAWARGMGCVAATIDGRKGWERVLGALGYRQIAGLLRKALR